MSAPTTARASQHRLERSRVTQLEQYRHRPKDLIITDVAMPELNGLDMLLELTRHFLNTKVIAISGVDGDANILDVAQLFGAQRTLRKPFSMPQLLDAVRYELEH